MALPTVNFEKVNSFIAPVVTPVKNAVLKGHEKVSGTTKPVFDKVTPRAQTYGSVGADYIIRFDIALLSIGAARIGKEYGKDSLHSIRSKEPKSIMKGLVGLTWATSWIATSAFVNYVAWTARPTDILSQMVHKL